jgi:2-polyprenyl-3-methyl-5-hydroxy-6-metoxy-1,4-benzoquinol methylase
MKYSNLDVNHKRQAHNIFKKILDKYSNQKYPKILDVGCATGVIGRLKQDSRSIYGIEKSKQLIKIAKDNCEKVYKLDLNNFSAKKINQKEFDFIFFGDVLEHLQDPLKTLKKIIPLAKHNGLIIISLPNIAQIQFRLKHLFGNFTYTESGVMDENHLHFYTFKSGQKLIKQANLEIIKTYPSGTIVSYINILPTLLAAQFIFVCKKIDN